MHTVQHDRHGRRGNDLRGVVYGGFRSRLSRATNTGFSCRISSFGKGGCLSPAGGYSAALWLRSHGGMSFWVQRVAWPVEDLFAGDGFSSVAGRRCGFTGACSA